MGRIGAGLIMWKYGTSPYHNNTDKNWVSVKDSTWVDIVAPEGKKYNFRKTAVPNCRPGAPPPPPRGLTTLCSLRQNIWFVTNNCWPLQACWQLA